MLQTILTSLGVFISTSIDYLVILLILFARLKKPSHKAHIYAGMSVGLAILLAFSLLSAFVISFVPEDWMVGLLGLVPLYMGIHYIFAGGEEADENAIMEKIKDSRSGRLFWTVALLTIASGGDNLAVYIPYFSTLDWAQILLVLLVFALGIIALVETSQAAADLPQVSETIEKYEKWIIPVVFIGLGLYILLENGTVQQMIEWLL